MSREHVPRTARIVRLYNLLLVYLEASYIHKFDKEYRLCVNSTLNREDTLISYTNILELAKYIGLTEEHLELLSEVQFNIPPNPNMKLQMMRYLQTLLYKVGPSIPDKYWHLFSED